MEGQRKRLRFVVMEGKEGKHCKAMNAQLKLGTSLVLVCKNEWFI